MEKAAIILYKSVTGFTQKYAQLTAESCGCRAEDIKNIKAEELKNYDIVVYGARLAAGKIDGLARFRTLAEGSGAKLMLFATGATPNAAEDIIENMWKNNLSDAELESIPHFYMQAGLNYEKMPFAEKAVMKIMTAIMKRKKNKSAEEQGFADAIAASFDISSEEYAQALIQELLKN